MSRVHSLRRRLTLALLLAFLIGLGAAGYFVEKEGQQEREALKISELRSEACALLASLDLAGRPALTRTASADPSRVADPRFVYTLYDSFRQPVLLSAGLDQPLPFRELAGPETCSLLRLPSPDARMALVARAVDGNTLVVAHRGLDQGTMVDIYLHEAYEVLFVFVPFALAAVALIWLIGMWSLRPLSRASREAAAIGPANTSGRVGTEGLPNEVRPLVDAANGAFERLDRAYIAQRRFTADAAHELRTPLAVLNLRMQRARIDAVLDWPAMERDLAHMNRVVGQLMDLARKEDPARAEEAAELTEINLSRVVREAAAVVLPLAEEHGRPLEVEAPAVVSIRGRADDLRDAVRNLLDNALAHGGGPVRARVSQEVGGGSARAIVEVIDEGPGIAESLKDTLFDRFRKAVPTSPGAGLGLAIVRHIVRAHGGEVSVRPGPGCTMQISLPAQG